MAKANDKQVGGGHYKTPGAVEHWDIVVQHDLDYFQGQITKYIMRWRDKNGVEDLEKARHFLDKYIELAQAAESGDRSHVIVDYIGTRHLQRKVGGGKKVSR